LDPFVPRIQALLERYPKITGERLYEELRDAGYAGGISILRDRLKQLRPRPRREPVIRFETEPGCQGQMDWSPYTIPFTRDGKLTVQCFSYILSFSRRQCIDFTLRRDFYTLIRRHQDAFAYFNGVPKHCLYDGEKTIVLRREAGQPVYNPAFIAFITHYRCKPIICWPGRPETKGKIEAPFQYIEKNLLGGREFSDLEDLRATARWWLRSRSDLHIHGTTGRPPIELFREQEARALEPLPAHPYDTAEVLMRVCGYDGFVEFETNRYSVPYEYGADILALKATEQEISIYSPELDLVVRHERLPAGAGKTVEEPGHRGSKQVRYGLEPVRQAFLALGDAAGAFLEGLKQRYPRNCGFHARHILRLKERYHCDDIHRAIEHAIRYLAFDGKAIERILRARARPRTLESLRDERARETLERTLPHITQRPLQDYKTLFCNKEQANDENESSHPGARESPADPGASEDPETGPNGAGTG
jgi:transposase